MSQKNVKYVAPEWSFLIDADKVSHAPLKIMIQPNPEERKLLSQRLGLKSLDSLKADIVFSLQSGKIHADGVFEAQVKQVCVVSGKPINSTLKESFEAWFSDRDRTVSLAKIRKEKEVEKGKVEMPIMEESEDPEPIIDGKIDAGELVAQYLSLAIDPFPHAEGVAYEHGDDVEKPKKQRLDNPFAALKDWKANKGKD
jgi:hypothetical protein